MTFYVQNPTNVLPADISDDFPGYACLLGNLLETASVFFSLPDFSRDMVRQWSGVLPRLFLLSILAPFLFHRGDESGKET